MAEQPTIKLRRRSVADSSLVFLFCLSLLFNFSLFFTPHLASATERPEMVPEQAAIVEHLSETISLDLAFTDQHGNKRPLRDLFIENRPLVFAPVYFECPRLCTLTQEGLLNSLNQLDLNMGRDYKVVSLSFDSDETAEMASRKAERYHALFKEPEHARAGGWDFLVGEEAAIKQIMREVGFSYEKDGDEFIHAAVLVVITPEGRISRYLYGIQFPPNELRLALVEAARGKIGTTMDKVFLFCFRYDHIQGQYTLAIWNVVRAICFGIFIISFAALIHLRSQERKRKRLTDSESTANG